LTSLVNQKLLNVNPLWTDCRFALFSGPHFVWYRGCFSLDASIYVNSGLISTVYAFFFVVSYGAIGITFLDAPLDLKHEASSLIRGVILAKK